MVELLMKQLPILHTRDGGETMSYSITFGIASKIFLFKTSRTMTRDEILKLIRKNLKLKDYLVLYDLDCCRTPIHENIRLKRGIYVVKRK